MNDANKSIIITYDSPGYAYNWKDYWAVQGFSYEPKKKSNEEFVFERFSIGLKSDLTNYTEQNVVVKIIVDLPKGATKARYDKDARAVKYEMPPPMSLSNSWSDNRTLLSIIFGGCTLLFAGFLFLVLTRKTKGKRPTAGTAPVAAATPGETTEKAEQEPADAEPAPSATESKRGKFCGYCGKKLRRRDKGDFCPYCGSPL